MAAVTIQFRHILISHDHGVSPGRLRTSSSLAHWNLFWLFMQWRKCWSSLHRQLILRPRKNRSIASSLRRVRDPSQHHRRVIKDAGSFGDSTLTRFFPLVEEDETLLKILELDAEVIEYLGSTYKLDWDPAKPFGVRPNTATKEAERFAKQVESTSALLARLSIYLQWTQGFISATILNQEKERVALLAGLPPPPMPECMVDETLAGAVSLANYLTAAIVARSWRLVSTAGFISSR